jgi:outer membrane protein OmpA-like peptidoglycan-associated protein
MDIMPKNLRNKLKMKTILFFCLIIIDTNLQAQDSIVYPVYFEYKAAQIDTNEMKMLRLIFKNLSSYQITDIKISAYCDERGGKKYNDKLSIARANAVFNFIREQNLVDSSVIKRIEGRGFISLINEENMDEQRRINRRGELHINYEKKQAKTTNPLVKKQVVVPVKIDSNELKVSDFITKAKEGEKLNLKVIFEGGRHLLLSESKLALDNVIIAMSSNARKFKILGHVYANGISENIDGYDRDTRTNDLSKRRAQMVFKYLTDKGIDKSRLTYEGLGARFPSGISPEQDRRVELEVAE